MCDPVDKRPTLSCLSSLMSHLQASIWWLMHYVASEISNAAIYSFLEGLKLNLDIMQVYLVLCTCRDSDCFQESPKPCLYSKWSKWLLFFFFIQQFNTFNNFDFFRKSETQRELSCFWQKTKHFNPDCSHHITEDILYSMHCASFLWNSRVLVGH